MTARLAEAEELERNFLMSVSHELRTPLTAIRGHVAALREGVVTDPESIDASLEIVAERGRAARTARRRRARPREARRPPVHRPDRGGRHGPGAASAPTRRSPRRPASAGSSTRSEAESAPVIVSDGDRVLQIISNLLSNAFRWTPDGGRIDLALQTANGTVTVDVADSGPGITADARERIFRPFWSTDGRGTGLGPADRARAGGGARRPDRAADRGGQGEPLPARPAEPQLLARSRLLRGARAAGATACSTRSSRSLTPRQPDETRSTSSARSSMRACRSARTSPSSRSSRRITWLSSPRISARLRPTGSDLGAEAVVHGGADLLGQRALELRRGRGERLDLDARALERGLQLGRRDPPGRGFRDPRLRPFECLLVHGQEATLAVGWTPPSSTTTCPRS